MPEGCIKRLPFPFIPFDEYDKVIGQATVDDGLEWINGFLGEKKNKGVEETTMQEKSVKELLMEGMNVDVMPGKTVVHIVAKHHEREANVLSHISCGHCIPFGGYAYDPAKDMILVRCVESMNLGVVPGMLQISQGPVVFGRESQGVVWSMYVPFPVEYIQSKITGLAKKRDSSFRDKYNREGYDVFYIQMRKAG